MTQKELGGHLVDIDEEGFLTDPRAWNKEIALALAAEEGLEMTDRHWTVIDFMRSEHASTGQAPTIRTIKKKGGIPTKELYALYPGGPAKKAARIAGLAKPTGCL